MAQPIPEDVIIAALNNDEPKLGIHLGGEIPPLGTSLLGSVHRIDNDMVPKRELLSGKSPEDKVGSVMRRPGLAHPRAPHRRFSLVHPEHGAAERSPQIEGWRNPAVRLLICNRETGDDSRPGQGHDP